MVRARETRSPDDGSEPNAQPDRAEASRVGLRITRSLGTAAGAVVGACGVLVAEASWTRRHTGPKLRVVAPDDSGLFDPGYGGEPIRLTILGDSNAAGVGVPHADETVGSHLAAGLATAAKRPVALCNVAFSGAQTRDLAAQIAGAAVPAGWPDVCLIVVGGNDVMHLRSISRSAQLLGESIRLLRSRGAEVVVATCPDMGAERPLLQPLRLIAGRYGKLLALSQTIVALRAGARTVSLVDSLGPIFRHFSAEMFASDRFHPSPAGYALAADVLLPSVCAASARFIAEKKPYPHRVYRRPKRRPATRVAFWLARRPTLGQMSCRTKDIRH
ncbi:SGNH/GDSL hydrolase family protein [Spelaeicoccus albus]|uniref:Lysophospholipase L1-like esterase n=1 Tax=Spelaeicoccus albus TaxID=1280376 RepID=A0A7Z0IHR1_9MICO|nr:SGNH/GDSL hydrolase family protein [Spelaeicoccus albus]NYI67880.1 lysophospholipase L1-like esterase [Spelaeicoccus albus]